MTSAITRINSKQFYQNYYGHPINDLHTLYKNLKTINPNKHFIYLAGDSSLDNKHWLPNNEYHNLSNNYDQFMQPPLGKPDICYHMNNMYKDYYTINCAVEESSIGKRENQLLAQDQFIHDNITNDDILIVSVGGNDVALSPTLSTIWNMVLLIYLNSMSTLTDDPLNAWGISYFIDMFRHSVKEYVLKLIGNKKPKKIIICMIYYPDMKMTGSWADKTLGYLGYNTDPKKLQKAIEQIFYHATCKIRIKGTKIVALPLFHYLNGQDTKDYIQRVEPSSQGGKKMAEAFIGAIKN